ncbi:MAG TPA: aminomethyltransferase family protein [Vicinamibacterales bacterium]|nr:aminomethyltransferase family protein [Vicinamibacterales bacterium]
MPVGTPFHERTFALSESLSYRDWSGYYAASSYETHHDHEYHAIRNAAALIDISPLFKYSVTGPDAVRLVDRVITRDAQRMAVGQVFYTPWCDEQGKVIDDGTVARLDEERFRWTAAEPCLRWLRLNAAGLRVEVEDISEQVAALALQGPLSARLLRAAAEADIAALRYFRVTSGSIDGNAVEISRTGYTGDLGYEIWMPRASALAVWDALMRVGRDFGLRAAGMLALDVARVEAGLLLIDVDFHSSRKATIPSQLFTPYEMGLGRLVSLAKGAFIGRDALVKAHQTAPRRQIVGLEIDWTEVAALHERVGLVPTAPAAASRTAVPVSHDGRQVGRATTTAWSPTMKKLLALATLDAPHFAAGTRVKFEVTVDAVRHAVAATVVPTPFLNLARKTAMPPG